MTSKAKINKVPDIFPNLCAAFKSAAVVFNNLVCALVFNPIICAVTQEIEFSLVGG